MNKTTLKKFAAPLVFISSALLIFFFSAFSVVVFRTKSPSKSIMPNLLGRTYVEVHNELSRLRLKVKIESKRFPDKLDGMILYQSIAPGKPVEAGSKVFVTVNIGTDRLKMPELVGLHLDNAKAKLKSVLSSDTYVSLVIGGVTFVEAEEGQQPDTIIQQIPQAGKMITTSEKVYLLVTNPNVKDKKSTAIDKDTDFIGQNFPLLQKKLQQEKKKWQLDKVVLTKKKQESALIESAKWEKDVLHLQVFYYKPKHMVESGYETLELPILKSGKYKLVAHPIISSRPKSIDPESLKGKFLAFTSKEQETEEPITLLQETEYQANSNLKTIFYRTGDWRVKLLDTEGKTEKTLDFRAKL